MILLAIAPVRYRFLHIAGLCLVVIAGGCRTVRPASDPRPNGPIPDPPHIAWLTLPIPGDIVESDDRGHPETPNHPDGIAVRSASGDLIPLIPIEVSEGRRDLGVCE